MTEEIIKECKNCDALGIDSEIGVYYCCLSHRQDDLPKEFTCNDFTPNKQLNRLEQENKELKKTIKQYCEWLDEERESNDKLQKVYQNDHCDLLNYRSALEEIREIVTSAFAKQRPYKEDFAEIETKINEVLS